MKGRQIVLDHINGREAAALMVDGQLDDLLVDSAAPRAGTIYRAVADRPLKGQGGVVVKTPDGPAFLRQIKGMAPGDRILVQVTGLAERGKAIPVSHKVLFKSRYVIVTPGAPGINVSRSIKEEELRDTLLGVAHEVVDVSELKDVGLILRSACAAAPVEDIADDIRTMLEQAESIVHEIEGDPELLLQGDGPHVAAWRDWSEPAEVVTESGSFETHGVLDAIEEAEGASVRLEAGAHMYVEPTRALVAVDVNTGADTSPAAGTKANFSSAKALPRALRVRGLGGQIVLDLAPMPKKDRRGFEAVLRAAFRRDSIDTTLVGWTPLGHYELQRKNSRPALKDVLK